MTDEQTEQSGTDLWSEAAAQAFPNKTPTPDTEPPPPAVAPPDGEMQYRVNRMLWDLLERPEYRDRHVDPQLRDWLQQATQPFDAQTGRVEAKSQLAPGLTGSKLAREANCYVNDLACGWLRAIFLVLNDYRDVLEPTAANADLVWRVACWEGRTAQ